MEPLKLAHLLEALAVFLLGHDRGQEQLHVADGLLHDHVKHTQQGAPLIQHLLGARCREIPWTIHTNTKTHTYTHTARTDVRTNICRQTADTSTHIDLQHAAQMEIRVTHYPEHKLHDHRGWDLQSAAFDQSLQNVVHRAANKQREEVCECVWEGFLF